MLTDLPNSSTYQKNTIFTLHIQKFNLTTNSIPQAKGLKKYANSSFNQKTEFKETLKISSN